MDKADKYVLGCIDDPAVGIYVPVWEPVDADPAVIKLLEDATDPAVIKFLEDARGF